MKVDWTEEGWRLFEDDAPDHGREGVVRVVSGSLLLPGPVELVQAEGPDYKHGWLTVPGRSVADVLTASGIE
jgi:hypothetical protein